MSLKQLLKQITIVAVVAGTTYSTANPAWAQFFDYYYPSASFFIPLAGGYESEEEVDLATMLDIDKKFATFNANLQKAELLKTLEKEKFITVLAPTEKAFAALSPNVQQKLSKPENLKKVLQYHLVIGNIGENDIKRRAVATVLEQNSVQITGVPLENNKIGVKLNEAKASDPLRATDGVIIPIDRVLIPPSL